MKKTKLSIVNLAIFAALLLVLFQNCQLKKFDSNIDLSSSAAVSDSFASVAATYTDINEKIFLPKCASCHNSGSLNFSSHDSLLAGSSVVAGDAFSSKLYQEIVSGSMPMGSSPLSTAEVAAIREWIDAGAVSGSALQAVAPNAADNLVALALSQTQVSLNWELPAQPVTAVNVERSSNISGPFVSVAILNQAASSYNDTGLNANATYYYRVMLQNLAGDSPYSLIASVTTQNYPPSAPSNLNGSGMGTDQAYLYFTDNSSDESGFKIERSLSATGPFAQVAALAANMTSFTDTGLAPGTAYYYRAYAHNAAGMSGYSNVFMAQTVSPPTNPPPTEPTNTPPPETTSLPPNPPSSLAATAVSSSQINLTWTDNSSNETSFRVERATNSSGPFTAVATVAKDLTSASISGLTPATTYYFRVFAVGVSTSTMSNTASAATPASVTVQAPGSLTATAISISSIRLSWADNSSSEAGFKVERALVSSGPYTVLTTTAANATTYTDTTGSVATTYFYRVSATSSLANSSYSSLASATTFATYSWIAANIIRPTSSTDTSQCLNCHGVTIKGGVDLSTYAKVFSHVVPGNAASSALYQSVVADNMPASGTKLNTAEKNAIKSWIDSGAPNN